MIAAALERSNPGTQLRQGRNDYTLALAAFVLIIVCLFV